MWEFCISIEKDKKIIKNFIYEKLSIYKKEYDCVLTVNEKNNCYDIVVACDIFEKNRLILFLQDLICECICYFYKKEYLVGNLVSLSVDETTKQAFIYALLYFDKETDKFIVNKFLNIDKKLNLDGYYNFRLIPLKEKWQELIEIANQNEIYLYSNETFTELIKFLIDNIEVKSDVVNIMQTNDSYDIFDDNFERIYSDLPNNEIDKNLVANLITMCPKNINIYCSDLLTNDLKNLICKLFEKRVKFISKTN